MSFNEYEYKKKHLKFLDKYMADYHFKKMTEKESILYVLRDLDFSIHPYSKRSRWGYKKHLKKAIKIIEEVLE